MSVHLWANRVILVGQGRSRLTCPDVEGRLKRRHPKRKHQNLLAKTRPQPASFRGAELHHHLCKKLLRNLLYFLLIAEQLGRNHSVFYFCLTHAPPKRQTGPAQDSPYLGSHSVVDHRTDIIRLACCRFPRCSMARSQACCPLM